MNPNQTNNNGNKDSQKYAPLATFYFTPTDAVDPATITFHNYSQSAYSYHWDFGNNQTSTETDPTVIFTEGVWTVSLIAYNEDKTLKDESFKTVTIKPAYKKAILTAITVNSISFLMSNGTSAWDIDGSGPDLRFNIMDGDTKLFSIGDYDNVKPNNIPFSSRNNPLYTFSNLNKTYSILLYDVDPIGNELMASFSLPLSSYLSGSNIYPAKVTLNSGQNYSIDFFFTWSY